MEKMDDSEFKAYFSKECPTEQGDFDSIYEEVCVCKTCKHNASQSDFNERCSLLNQRKDKDESRK